MFSEYLTVFSLLIPFVSSPQLTLSIQTFRYWNLILHGAAVPLRVHWLPMAFTSVDKGWIDIISSPEYLLLLPWPASSCLWNIKKWDGGRSVIFSRFRFVVTYRLWKLCFCYSIWLRRSCFLLASNISYLANPTTRKPLWND